MPTRGEDDDVPDDVQAPSAWEPFLEDAEPDPIRVAELVRLDLASMPPDASVWIMDDNLPEVRIQRVGDRLVLAFEEHLYTKYWQHKYSAYAFSAAMERAVRRLADEGHPLSEPSVDDEDVHIFVRWHLTLSATTSPTEVPAAIRAAFDLVWRRADAILENSDSVLILGKDTGDALARLQVIASTLDGLGYHTYIIKELPDNPGEGVIQKVLRYALSSKFVIIENTDPSGHLYEVPHIVKTAEAISVVVQEDGKGATWMFEDLYAKLNSIHKFVYPANEIADAVIRGARWAEGFRQQYSDYQMQHLPWLKR